MNPPPRTVDLNADLGEGFPNDRAILGLVTSASIACGVHAGDRDIVLRTLRDAERQSIILGAHPGFADRDHFGRRNQRAARTEVQTLVGDQVRWLASLAAEFGLQIRYVKPHGALYNQAQGELEIAEGVLDAVARIGLPLLGQPGTLLQARAHERRVPFLTEGFPDRRYQADGRLAPRSEPGAILDDPLEVERQVIRLVDAGVASLCIHGDDPRAVEIARTVRGALENHGIKLRGWV